jgi:Flp pilus assembly protein TadB
MDAPAILTLVGMGVAVVAIATYLIIIAMILQRVVNRLVVILDAVGQTTRRSEPIGPALDDINRDLDHGRAAIEAAVDRLVQSHGAPNGDAIQPLAAGAKRPQVRSGYSAASAAADDTITARANTRRGDPSAPGLYTDADVSRPPETTTGEPGERGVGDEESGRRWWNR